MPKIKALTLLFNIQKIGYAKNFSFIYDDITQQWHLSPAYDLTPNKGIAGEHTTTVNGKGKNITHADMLDTAKRIGITQRKAKEIIERIDEVVSLSSLV